MKSMSIRETKAAIPQQKKLPAKFSMKTGIKPAEPVHHQAYAVRQITRRRDVDSEAFIQRHNGTGQRIVTEATITRIPTMKTSTKVKQADVMELLNQHNAQTIGGRRQPIGTNHSFRVHHVVKPPTSSSDYAKQFKAQQRAKKEEQDMLELLKRHNQGLKRTR
jgi:hypothetical protein